MEVFIFIVVIVLIIVIIISKDHFSSIEEKFKKVKKKNDEWSQINNPISEMNNRGISLEKQKMIKEAIAIYESNINYIEKNYDKLTHIAIHSFERLMILYHKINRFEDEKKILLTGLSMKAKLDSRTTDKWERRLDKINEKST